jgi:hypothetical protein
MLSETFGSEVMTRFGFLVTDYGFVGSMRTATRAEYARAPLTIKITYDTCDKMVETKVRLGLQGRSIRVGPRRLAVEASG